MNTDIAMNEYLHNIWGSTYERAYYTWLNNKPISEFYLDPRGYSNDDINEFINLLKEYHYEVWTYITRGGIINYTYNDNDNDEDDNDNYDG